MLARAFFLTSLAALATTAVAAQVPFEHFVVSTRSPGSGSAAWFVDPGTGDVTPITGLVAPLDELTIVTEEPMSGALFLGEALSSSLSPTMQFVPLAGRSAGGALRVTWSGPRGPMSDALFGAGGNLFMLIGGSATGAGLYTGVLIGGPTLPLGAVADGVAIAADASAVYVLTNKTGFPSTIWRYDVASSAFRQVVAVVPPAKAFDLFPGGTNKLLVGGQSGDLYLADAATGQVSLYQAVGRGAIAALRHSRAGTTLFATDTGGLYTLASLPNALAQLPRVPTDIDVGTIDAASFFTFGNGCAGSGNFVPAIGSTGLPAVGNAGFALTVAGGPGGAPAIFALGNSRKSWGAIPLPFDLAGVGAAGCAIAANGVVLSALALSGSGAGSGAGTLPLPIPNQLALVGVKLMAQWWILDPPANALGLTVSDGGEGIVR